MTKSPRITITESLDHISPRDFDRSLKDLQAYIEILIDECGEDATLSWEPNFYYEYDTNPTPRFEISKSRPETDDEYEFRIKAYESQKNLQDEKDRAEFERLSQKFGKK